MNLPLQQPFKTGYSAVTPGRYPCLLTAARFIVLAASNYGPADSRSSFRLRCSTLVHITTVRTLPLTTLRRVARNAAFAT